VRLHGWHFPAKRRVVEVFDGTFTANPMTMSAGLAAMEMLDAEMFSRLEELGDRLAWKLQCALTSADVAGQITG
jgi:glutamate-1-semialdehyde 2,1-aminomutase